MNDGLIAVIKELFNAWREGNAVIRRVLITGFVSAFVAVISAIILDTTKMHKQILQPIGRKKGRAQIYFTRWS